jgi:hypothetical protein
MKKSGKQLVEYSQLCKAIRTNMRKDLRDYNKKIKETIENNRGVNKLFRTMAPRKQIISLKEEDGTITRNRQRIVERTKEFFEKLYAPSGVNLPTISNIDQEISPITQEEIHEDLRGMTNGKSPGSDAITVELQQKGGPALLNVMSLIFTRCLEDRRIPQVWNEGEIILIHKKGDTQDLKNYRPITLMSVFYKLFTIILGKRAEGTLDSNQPREQAGFRKGFGTLEHLFTINQVVQKSHEFKLPLCMAFIDYEKAFDSIKTSSMIDAITKKEWTRKLWTR